MKTLFYTIGILAISLSVLADDKYGYQKRDWIDKDKINIRVGGGYLSIDEFLD